MEVVGKGPAEEGARRGVVNTEFEVLREMRGQGTFQAEENLLRKRTKRRESSLSVSMVWPRRGGVRGGGRLPRREGPWQDKRHPLKLFLWKEFWQWCGMNSFICQPPVRGQGEVGLRGRSRVRWEAERPVGSVLKKGLN